VDDCKPLAGGPERGQGRRVPGAPHHGEAVQVDPIKHTLKAPGITRLKLSHDESPSKVAFKFNLRRYTLGPTQSDDISGRDLHSSTFRLNVSTSCGIRFVHGFPPVY
jgi:hypothetical protein